MDPLGTRPRGALKGGSRDDPDRPESDCPESERAERAGGGDDSHDVTQSEDLSGQAPKRESPEGEVPGIVAGLDLEGPGAQSPGLVPGAAEDEAPGGPLSPVGETQARAEAASPSRERLPACRSARAATYSK